MGLVDRIKRALNLKKKIAPLENLSEHDEVSKLKKKIWDLENDVAKQGKRVESLTVVLDPLSPSKSVFDFVLSDVGTNKAPPKKPTPNPKKPTKTLVGKSYDYDEKLISVQEYQPGLKVFLVVRRDGVRDIVKATSSDKEMSVPKTAIWWIENKEKVCERFNVTATKPKEAPLISMWTHIVNNISN